MPRIRVKIAPVHHRASGLRAWEPGEYEFSDQPEYAGWLDGMVERGAVEILPEPNEDDLVAPLAGVATTLDGEDASGAEPQALIGREELDLPELPPLDPDQPVELVVGVSDQVVELRTEGGEFTVEDLAEPKVGEATDEPRTGIEVAPGETGVLTSEEPVEVNDPLDIRAPIRCTATTAAGKPCGSWALEGSDRCRMHPREA